MPFNDTCLHWDLEMLFFILSMRSEPQILSFHHPGDPFVYGNLVLSGIPNPNISNHDHKCPVCESGSWFCGQTFSLSSRLKIHMPSNSRFCLVWKSQLNFSLQWAPSISISMNFLHLICFIYLCLPELKCCREGARQVLASRCLHCCRIQYWHQFKW